MGVTGCISVAGSHPVSGAQNRQFARTLEKLHYPLCSYPDAVHFHVLAIALWEHPQREMYPVTPPSPERPETVHFRVLATATPGDPTRQLHRTSSPPPAAPPSPEKPETVHLRVRATATPGTPTEEMYVVTPPARKDLNKYISAPWPQPSGSNHPRKPKGGNVPRHPPTPNRYDEI